MKLILEGADGAGKSTLARQLAEHFNCDLLVMTEFGSKKKKDYETKAVLDNIISDRSFLSELVYATVSGRNHLLTIKDYEELLFDYICKDWFFIILDADTDTLIKRINERGYEDPWKIEKIEKIRWFYRMLARFYDLPIIDTTKINSKELIKNLEEGKYGQIYCKQY